MKVKTSRVQVNGSDIFGDASAAADFINNRAANAGLSSVQESEDNSHIVDFLKKEISECAPEIRGKLMIETVIEEIDE